MERKRNGNTYVRSRECHFRRFFLVVFIYFICLFVNLLFTAKPNVGDQCVYVCMYLSVRMFIDMYVYVCVLVKLCMSVESKTHIFCVGEVLGSRHIYYSCY